MTVIQHTILVMASTVDVDAHFNQPPLVSMPELDRIKQYTRTALAKHLLLHPEQFQTDFDTSGNHEVWQPVSLRHNAADFFRVLEYGRHQWHRELKALFVQLSGTLAVAVDNTLAHQDLFLVVDRILEHVQQVVRSANSCLQKSWFQPEVFEILARIAWLFSGHFDEESIFFDLQTGSSRIPEQEEVGERHSATTKMGGDFWILPVMLSL